MKLSDIMKKKQAEADIAKSVEESTEGSPAKGEGQSLTDILRKREELSNGKEGTDS